MIQTNGYGDVIAWLRGGDVTPDSHMEKRFVEMLSTLVAECIVANRKEIQRLCTAADRKERRENRTPSGLSLRALMQETSGTSVPEQIPASARMERMMTCRQRNCRSPRRPPMTALHSPRHWSTWQSWKTGH